MSLFFFPLHAKAHGCALVHVTPFLFFACSAAKLHSLPCCFVNRSSAEIKKKEVSLPDCPFLSPSLCTALLSQTTTDVLLCRNALYNAPPFFVPPIEKLCEQTKKRSNDGVDADLLTVFLSIICLFVAKLIVACVVLSLFLWLRKYMSYYVLSLQKKKERKWRKKFHLFHLFYPFLFFFLPFSRWVFHFLKMK